MTSNNTRGIEFKTKFNDIEKRSKSNINKRNNRRFDK